MLTNDEKSDVRRHLDYGVIGQYRQSPVGGTLAPFNTGLRIFGSWGQLEYKMNNLLPGEEARLTGRSYAAIGFSNPNPLNFTVPIQPGSTIQVSVASTLFSASPVVVDYTVSSTDTFLTVCGQIANLFGLNGVFTSAGFYAFNDFGAGPYGQPTNPSQLVTFPIVSFVAPVPGVNFTITVTGTGSTIPQVTRQGYPLNPSLTSGLTYPPTIINGYVPICNYLEDQMFGQVSDNLSAYKANDAILRMAEPKERIKLYKMAVKRLSTYISIIQNPDNPGNTGSQTIGNWSIC